MIDEKALEAAWQPIETAPKDGTDILVFCQDDWGMSGCINAAYYDGEYGWRACGCEERLYNQNATQWAPLPLPPQTEEGGA